MKKTNPPNADDRTFMEQEDFADDMSSPIGRLMSDETDDEPTEETNAFVSGFSRNQPEEPSAPIERRSRRERPASPSSEEDFFEAGIREARASRDRDRRRRPTNPDPRPAVRAGVPTPKRMTSPLRRDDEYALPDSPPEDQYDTFRQRYNPDELISTTRGPRPQRRGAPQREREEIDLSASRGFASRFADDEGERTSLVRWVAIAGVIVVLGVMIILATGRTSAINRYNAAAYRVRNMEAAYLEHDAIARQNDARAIEIDSLNDRINYLENRLEQLTPATTTGTGVTPPGPGADATTDYVPATPGGFPATHIVESGQTLSRIARLFYGSGTDTEVQLWANHIAAYNNIADPSLIRVGDVLTIPPLP